MLQMAGTAVSSPARKISVAFPHRTQPIVGVGLRLTARYPTPLDEEPEDEHGFTDESEPTDIKGVSRAEHSAEPIHDIPDTGH